MDNNKLNQDVLNPSLIPKFVSDLPIMPTFWPEICRDENNKIYCKYCVSVKELKVQMLPPSYPKTKAYGYGGMVTNINSNQKRYMHTVPGPTFEAIRYLPNKVTWKNELDKPHMFAVDPTLHWADPNHMHMHIPKPWPYFPPGFPKAQYPIPIVTHLHGGETSPLYDGHPDDWITFDGKKGPEYKGDTYEYLNRQPPTTLWYHDHTLGMTRLNVYAGLGGMYVIRDLKNCLDNPKNTPFPSGKYEIPLIIQDKTFYEDGSLMFPTVGDEPELHPYWQPEFFGNTILVNGKTWPKLNVEQRAYRFRILNASNSRFYNLKLSNKQCMIQIGSDGGYLCEPVQVENILIAPAERVDVIIDFSKCPLGTEIVIENNAAAPFPMGEAVDPETTGKVLKFVVNIKRGECVKLGRLPRFLNKIPKLIPNRPKRILTLVEVSDGGMPTEILLNGQKWSAAISENPVIGSTEIWELVNLTNDTHPIHLHLIQFQLLNRQVFEADRYKNDWLKQNPNPPLTKPTVVVNTDDYLIGTKNPPPPEESGWKDTIKAYPGQITRIIVRFAPLDLPTSVVKPGCNFYKFDPTVEPGYVWHCHMLAHEDNEMMRPYKIKKK